jgi:hypothetical protein
MIFRRRRRPDDEARAADAGKALVKIASAGNEAEAQMWREVLEHNGIPCMVRAVGDLFAYLPFNSQHDLYVAAAQADRARDLLTAYNDDRGDLAPDDEDAGEEPAAHGEPGR